MSSNNGPSSSEGDVSNSPSTAFEIAAAAALQWEQRRISLSTTTSKRSSHSHRDSHLHHITQEENSEQLEVMRKQIADLSGELKRLNLQLTQQSDLLEVTDEALYHARIKHFIMSPLFKILMVID